LGYSKARTSSCPSANEGGWGHVNGSLEIELSFDNGDDAILTARRE
jgi:hypothetical protein